MGVLKRNGKSIPKSLREERRMKNTFPKNHVPFNKGKKQSDYMSEKQISRSKATRFKKGNIPHNTKYDGHERITKDGYIEVRIEIGNYRLKHLVEWERKKGKLPKGHCLWCIDGNKMNTSPDNWELITRKENLKRNVHTQPLDRDWETKC